MDTNSTSGWNSGGTEGRLVMSLPASGTARRPRALGEAAAEPGDGLTFSRRGEDASGAGSVAPDLRMALNRESLCFNVDSDVVEIRLVRIRRRPGGDGCTIGGCRTCKYDGYPILGPRSSMYTDSIREQYSVSFMRLTGCKERASWAVNSNEHTASQSSHRFNPSSDENEKLAKLQTSS